MIRLILVALVLFGFLILGIPVLLIEWVIGKFNQKWKDYSSLRLVQGAFKLIMFMTGVKLTIIGEEHVPKDRAVLYVGNHRSYYDIPLLLAGLDRPHGILAKEELGKIPLLNRWMKLLGCVFVQRDDVRASVRALNDATAIVESGRSFVIFPEGTRYKGEEGGAGEFKQGAFRIAVKTGAPVVPVAITGARALFENNGNLCHPGTVRIKVLPPIQTAGMSRAEQKQLPDAVRQTILAEL